MYMNSILSSLQQLGDRGLINQDIVPNYHGNVFLQLVLKLANSSSSSTLGYPDLNILIDCNHASSVNIESSDAVHQCTWTSLLEMARVKAKYGRRPLAQHQFVADCFSSSSSPLQSPDAKASTTSQLPSPRIKKRRSDVPTKCTKTEDITQDDLVNGLQTLAIQDSQSKCAEDEGCPDSPAQNTRGRRVLQARDANAGVEGSIPNHRFRDCATKKPFKTGSPRVIINIEPKAELVSTANVNLQKKKAGRGLEDTAELPRATHCLSHTSTSAACSDESLATHASPLLALSSEPVLTSFDQYASALSAHFRITKLAEASYGEVYRLSLLPSTSTNLRTTFSHTDESVLKLIALKPTTTPLPATLTMNGKVRRKTQWTKAERDRIEAMSRIEDVAGEVRLLKRMSCVPGFTNFRALTVLRGPLPLPFQSAWHVYNENIKPSEYPDPSSSGAYFGDDQLWAVIEMQDAGRDLEAVIMQSVWSVWDAFWGIAIAMAKGEEWARYEHRDLHLGNVCVKWDETGTTSSEDINATPLDLGKKKLGYTGLETTIIDYTLSRAEMTDSSLHEYTEPASPSPQHPTLSVAPNAPDEDPDTSVAYLDLALDPSLFQGDAELEYQYEIYRCMRAAAYYSDPLASWPPKSKTKSKKASAADAAIWRSSHPLTNLVWLHYVLHKLCEGVVAWPSAKPRMYAAKVVQRHAVSVEEKLSVLCSILELENMNRGPGGVQDGLGSARDLVAWAVLEGWLDEDDVIACGLGKGGEEDTLLDLVEGLTLEDGSSAASAKRGKEAKKKRRKPKGDVLS
ncbi:hypothetical protein FH972_025069 [Carpinus fangiana]|uniref:non-specific serine/threonine protein kinase n=1 Tax=Carpinus fangiana TaxID=176857 RepID=A0A5N6L097_9ROSI|nr:hypothetical protein FH972_025069 [Carpinus fangiana]